MTHTILLFQQGEEPDTCTFREFGSSKECLENVCRLYEMQLRRKNGKPSEITYLLDNLFEFLDKVNGFHSIQRHEIAHSQSDFHTRRFILHFSIFFNVFYLFPSLSFFSCSFLSIFIC